MIQERFLKEEFRQFKADYLQALKGSETAGKHRSQDPLRTLLSTSRPRD